MSRWLIFLNRNDLQNYLIFVVKNVDMLCSKMKPWSSTSTNSYLVRTIFIEIHFFIMLCIIHMHIHQASTTWKVIHEHTSCFCNHITNNYNHSTSLNKKEPISKSILKYTVSCTKTTLYIGMPVKHLSDHSWSNKPQITAKKYLHHLPYLCISRTSST